MKVEIEQGTIDHGTPANPEWCALACALMELPLCYTASVGILTCTLRTEDGRAMTFALADDARDFVRAFDDGVARPRPVEVWTTDALGRPAKDWPACLGDLDT